MNIPLRPLFFQRFALNWQTNYPDHYNDLGLFQIQYAMPYLPFCYIICQQDDKHSMADSDKLGGFYYNEALRLATHHTGNPQTFILIESGSAVCKHKTSRHAHIFIIETRWQKAWLFSVLGMKNTLLALRGQ